MGKTQHDSATPAHGQQVISACAFIHHDFDGVTKVFLPKRATTKKFLPDIYELPGGHTDFGEDIVDSLRRELQEEHEMNIKVGDPFAAFTYENTVKGSHSIEVIYFATFVEPIEQIKLHPEDHSRYDWLTREEVVQRRSELVPTSQAIHKEDDQDAEYKAVLKGFDILAGEAINVGQ